jgi:hypothetical protein
MVPTTTEQNGMEWNGRAYTWSGPFWAKEVLSQFVQGFWTTVGVIQIRNDKSPSVR